MNQRDLMIKRYLV